VGIGTTSPSAKLHVLDALPAPAIYAQNTGSGPAVLALSNSPGPAGYFQSESSPYDTAALYGVNTGNGYGIYGKGNIGCGVYGRNGYSSNRGYLGHQECGAKGYSSQNVGVIGEASGAGTMGIYGRSHSGNPGNDYLYSSTYCGVVGSAYNMPYHCGVQGVLDSYLGFRMSGVHGCFEDDSLCWGSLAYISSSYYGYGGYFTNYDLGTGKGSQGIEVQTGAGVGSWGTLFGADIHGKVYGVYAEGGNYALYTNGAVFKNDVDVHLQDTEASSMGVLYTNVSTDVTVQTSGFSVLSKGTCRIEFDEDFKRVVSPDVPVIVTVTPTGNSNGVYVSEVTKDGFTVMENNGGKSSVTVTFIAIGRRAGYEDPQLPAEVISSDYVSKLSRGLHNDADTQTDGEGLYYQNGQLYVGIPPSALPNLHRR
jgi:hypothetical protein